MTILNTPNDGLHPELISLFRAVAFSKKISSDELISVCSPFINIDDDEDRKKKEKEINNRLRGSLLRWIELGLFLERDDYLELSQSIVKSKTESLDDLAYRLPSICRRLILEQKNSLPLWGETSAVAGDFSRGITWLLAQDIYAFPSAWNGGAENIAKDQLVGGEVIMQNEVRWASLRNWARYLGFATGDSGAFQIDPTSAIKDELPFIFGKNRELSAKDFLNAISARLPVLDSGLYRQEIESKLKVTTWRKPAEGHLSMSLSLALRRLHLNSTIKLIGKADSGSSFRLTGKNYRTWMGFESVVFEREVL